MRRFFVKNIMVDRPRFKTDLVRIKEGMTEPLIGSCDLYVMEGPEFDCELVMMGKSHLLDMAEALMRGDRKEYIRSAGLLVELMRVGAGRVGATFDELMVGSMVEQKRKGRLDAGIGALKRGGKPPLN